MPHEPGNVQLLRPGRGEPGDPRSQLVTAAQAVALQGTAGKPEHWFKRARSDPPFSNTPDTGIWKASPV